MKKSDFDFKPLKSFTKEIIFSFSAGFLFIKKKKCMRRLPSGQRREVQGLILQGFGSSNLPLRIILLVNLYIAFSVLLFARLFFGQGFRGFYLRGVFSITP